MSAIGFPRSVAAISPSARSSSTRDSSCSPAFSRTLSTSILTSSTYRPRGASSIGRAGFGPRLTCSPCSTFSPSNRGSSSSPNSRSAPLPRSRRSFPRFHFQIGELRGGFAGFHQGIHLLENRGNVETGARGPRVVLGFPAGRGAPRGGGGSDRGRVCGERRRSRVFCRVFVAADQPPPRPAAQRAQPARRSLPQDPGRPAAPPVLPQKPRLRQRRRGDVRRRLRGFGVRVGPSPLPHFLPQRPQRLPGRLLPAAVGAARGVAADGAAEPGGAGGALRGPGARRDRGNGGNGGERGAADARAGGDGAVQRGGEGWEGRRGAARAAEHGVQRCGDDPETLGSADR
ncbi:uncharacterized protein [Blastocystis hominis]|uniref:Uncharacterized protein n=1 Tax=Blastocystis hominis TaxID=12968 RepID=D8LX06_BLAHO|nr:uncharacterized protein [Blastocystis hominis]CBK20801.2 unnamed protein product [Blastocystis hominis]|eukprot:XP_012894849.1 uncharacterized protein [Blastocystis hominis]